MQNHESIMTTLSVILANAYACHKDKKTELRNIKLFERKNNIWYLMIWKTNAPVEILKTLEHASQYAVMNGLTPEEQPLWADEIHKLGFKFQFLTEVQAAPVEDSHDEEYVIDTNKVIIDMEANQFDILACMSDNHPELLEPVLAFTERTTLYTIAKLIISEFMSDYDTLSSKLEYDLEVIDNALAKYNCVHMKEEDKVYTDVMKSELEDKS